MMSAPGNNANGSDENDGGGSSARNPSEPTPLTYLTAVAKIRRLGLTTARSNRNICSSAGSRGSGTGGSARHGNLSLAPSLRRLLTNKDRAEQSDQSERLPLQNRKDQHIQQYGQNIAEDAADTNNDADADLEELYYSTLNALIDIVFGKSVSVLLLAIPFACWANFQGTWSAAWVFWLNFMVMIPLASILGDFTEELALHTNETIGGLINATFGNAVEVVVAIQALMADEIRVVQASMLGSIFSNLLLVLGCCFFFGGLYYKEQTFNSVAATSNIGLLALSSIALVLPTPFAQYYNVKDEHVLVISRISAIFMIFMYAQMLFFQLYTHAHIFGEAVAERKERAEGDGENEEEEKEEEE